MRSPVVYLPSLLLICFALLLATRAPRALVNADADSHQQIQSLRQSIQKLSAQLSELEAKTHHVLPRGVTQTLPVSGGGLWPHAQPISPVREGSVA